MEILGNREKIYIQNNWLVFTEKEGSKPLNQQIYRDCSFAGLKTNWTLSVEGGRKREYKVYHI